MLHETLLADLLVDLPNAVRLQRLVSTLREHFNCGAVGLLRFPDIYTRIHGATTANPLGAVIIVTGLAIVAPSLAMAAKLLLLALLLGALGPLWSHVFASAAHAGGLAPVTGKYTAPRPGAGEPT